MITDEMLRRSAAISCDAFIRSVEACHQEEHVFSPAFEKKIRKLYGRANHPYLYRLVRQVASILLALLIGGCVWLTVDEEARAAFFGWVKEVYESAIGYYFVGDDVPVERKEYYIPALPEGYEEAFVREREDGRIIVYRNTDGQYLQFHYAWEMGAAGIVSVYDAARVSEATLSEVTVNGRPADFLSSNDLYVSNIIVWKVEQVVFGIFGFLEQGELISLAESVKEMPQ